VVPRQPLCERERPLLSAVPSSQRGVSACRESGQSPCRMAVGNLSPDARTVVLDEADRMLDMVSCPLCVPFCRSSRPNDRRCCSRRLSSDPWPTSSTVDACDTRKSARNTSLLAQVSSEQVAKRSLGPAASGPSCSGQFAGQTPSWRSAAATSTGGSRITGKAARQPDFHFHVAHPLSAIASLGKAIGPPWTQDQKYAALAALMALG
jgi:hypothetical protein